MTDRLIARTPCQGISLPRKVKKLVIPLPTGQVLALADRVPRRYRALVLVGAAAGLRQGEAFGLTLSQLNLDREARLRLPEFRSALVDGRQINLTQQLVLVTGKSPYVDDPKTAASVRVIPIPKFLVEALTDHLAEFGVGEDGLIFTDHRGRPLRRNRFSEMIRPAVKKSSIREGTTFHVLRHYYASLLIRSGASVKTVQNRLGHESATETLDTYGHLWPDSEERTREAFEKELGGALAQESEDSLRTGSGDSA